jgi:DNA polymerase-3 subunit gamma/tau
VLEWLSRHKRVTWTFVAQNAQVADYDGQRVVLAISTVGLAETFRRGAHADYVRQALIDVLGVDARVEGVPSEDSAPPAPPAAGPPRPADAGPGTASGAPTFTAPGEGPGAAPGAAPSTPPDAGASAAATGVAAAGFTGGGGARPTREPASWSEAPPPPDTAPSWASPLELAKATVAVEAEVVAEQHVVDDTAISDDDESIDDLTDVGVPVVERILGGTVIAEDPR